MLSTLKLNIILKTLVILTIVWFGVGLFPIINVEGDAALFIAGCERMFNNGILLPPDYFYEWKMQPLTGLLIVLLKYLLPFLSCEYIYLITSFCLMIFYNTVTSIIVSQITKLRWEYVFLLLSFFPSSYTIGYYGNTSIFSSIIFLFAITSIFKNGFNIVSLLLLAVAPSFRIDVVIVYPVLLPLLMLKHCFKRSVVYLIVYAISTVSMTLLLSFFLKSDYMSTFLHYKEIIEQKRLFDFQSFFEVLIGFFSFPGLLFFILGIIEVIRLKKYTILTICVLPLFSLIIAYGDFFGGAPKHLHYTLFSVILASSFSLSVLKSLFLKRKFYFFLIVTFVLFCSFIGVRIYPESKPWLKESYAMIKPKPTIFTIISTNTKYYDFELVFGAGQILPTADEFVLLNGNFFAPFFWNQIKQIELTERNKLIEIILNSDSLEIMSTQSSDWFISHTLHNLGYNIFNAKKADLAKSFSWNKFKYRNNNNNKTIYVQAHLFERNLESITELISNHKFDKFLLYVRWDWQVYMVKELKKSNDRLFVDEISDRLYIVSLKK